MEVRITKYDPTNRNELGHYTKDEWTSVSDICGKYDLSEEGYLCVEDKYWTTVQTIMNSLGLKTLRFVHWNRPSNHFQGFKFQNICQESLDFLNENGFVDEISVEDYEPYFRAAMREVSRVPVSGDNGFYLHFGYDFYLYAGSKKQFALPVVEGIWVEHMSSPYSMNAEDLIDFTKDWPGWDGTLAFWEKHPK